MKPAVQPQPQPVVQQPVASDMGAPRDARYGGAFMRGPAESYRPGYGQISGPMRPALQGLSNFLGGITKRANERMASVQNTGMNQELMMQIFSGKHRIPSNIPGVNETIRGGMNDAMILAAIMSAMKSKRKV